MTAKREMRRKLISESMKDHLTGTLCKPYGSFQQDKVI